MLTPKATIGTAITNTMYEYLLIVIPVGLYIVLHSSSTEEPVLHFFHSPEWNMATILLAFQGQSMYRALREVHSNPPPQFVVGLIMLYVLVAVVLAARSIPVLLVAHSRGSMILMWILFILTSLGFLFFVSAATFVVPTSGKEVTHA